MSTENSTVETKKTNKKFIIILVSLVVIGTIYGVSKYLHALHNEDTDDAQVSAHISPVIPRVSGYVQQILVSDNQQVKKGDTLVILDNREMMAKVLQAEAALENAKAGLSVSNSNALASLASVSSSNANVQSAEANIETAKVNLWRANQDYERYANLIKDHSITQQQYEDAYAAKQKAEKQLQVLIEQKKAAASQSHYVAAQSTASEKQTQVAQAIIKQREADLALAQLNLSYTYIIAQSAGKVSTVNIQDGQLVQSGQNLFNIVEAGPVWVVANFKETQLAKIEIGNEATIKVDALSGHQFKGKVQSIAPATGSKFALLPPDNASGNFVKVVQRIPVKILIDASNDPLFKKLRPGMNVLAEVHLN